MNEITSELLLVKHGSPCLYCSRTMNVHSTRLKPTREHIKPRCRFKKSRILIVCAECNGLKGNRTFDEFVAFLELKNAELERAIMLNKLRLKTLEDLTEEIR